MSGPISSDKEPKVIYADDCGNAPKKRVLRDFNIAFAKADMAFILDQVAENIEWNIVGDRVIKGKTQFAEMLKKMKKDSVLEIHLNQIITHGNVASANGLLVFDNNRKIAFCDVYLFNNFSKHAKIKEITSYVIELT